MDAFDLVHYFSALALVLGLLGLAFVAARKYGLAGVIAPLGQRRLTVSETMMLDARHKAFLLKRDGVEHLIICGPNGAVTVESGIVPVAAAHAVVGMPEENLAAEVAPLLHAEVP